MLPDLPKLKAEIQQVLTRHVSALARQKLGVFKDVARHYVHEGGKMRTIRADGSSEDSLFRTASAELAMDLRSTSTLTNEQRFEHLDKMASMLAEQMSAHLYGTLDEMLQAKGRVVDGSNFGPETIFAAIESLHMDFDAPDGDPLITIAMNPKMRELFDKAAEEIESDEALSARYEALIEKKRGEWRDREASRKLA